MDRLTNINPADKNFAASDATVQQPQQQQAEFEQHLGEARQVGPIYPHRDLYDVTEEDDRLIQAASGAALERGPPPGPTSVSIYDRRLRKLAEELKQSGKSMADLDNDTLLGYAKKLLPNDKIIAPALLMVERYREPNAAPRPAPTHYRPSKEDDRLIREAAGAGFGREMDAKTIGNYSSSLRKLAAALRPLSIAKLSDDALLGHANTLFPNDKKVIFALNRLREYRKIVGHINSLEEGDNSRDPIIQPAAGSLARVFDEQPLYAAADRDWALPAGGFDAPQWQGGVLAAHSPTQSVAQDVLFDAAEGNLPAHNFEAPVLWQGMRSSALSPVQNFAQEELFDAADGEGLPPVTTFGAPALWTAASSSAHSPMPRLTQEELFDAADREGPRPAMTFDAPVLGQPMSSAVRLPVQSVVQEDSLNAAGPDDCVPADRFDAQEFWWSMWSASPPPIPSVGREELFDAAIWHPSPQPQNPAPLENSRRMTSEAGAAPAVLEQAPPTATDSFDASLTVPEDFSHGTQPAPDMMRSKLGRWGLLPDAAQRVKSYDIRGERYTAVLGPEGPNDIQLIHLRSPAVGDTFDVSFAVPTEFSHRTQAAPDMLLSTLGKWDFLPDAEQRIMNYEIGGERYTAVLGPEGPNDVQLIYHPRLTLPGDAPPMRPAAASAIPGTLAPGFDPPASFGLRESAHMGLAQNPSLPSAPIAAGHQQPPQLPELGELFGDDWRHGPQEASPIVIDMLQNLNLLPNEHVPMTGFLIYGQLYTAESLPGGRVLLFHRPQFG
ncbi:hypothetical protein CWO91_23140 [Bradyrhizobium genosp. SA-3]|uniref:hypothetical protein n=1 Tax=Bradyrhizobium genosp. SA-3 TaxID=508868 RepID=UPI00102959AA|nr:hypothetical protein [Bradyrhizobium genosp. SA-3]RZN08310.1 hypothetical protein CWO91_23140 [Bradyrhizobium genosp. SA-3]